MVEQIVAPIFQRMVGFVVDTTVKQFSYLFSYSTNIENLREELTDLGNAREEVQMSVDAAKRKLQVIREDAQSWMTRVDKIQTEAKNVLEDTSKVEKGCGWKGTCPNLKQRYLLSKKAVTHTAASRKLRGKSGKDDKKVGRAALPPGMLFAPLTEGSYGFESRNLKMNDIQMALKDDKINKIGICGMAGIGKTVLVKQIWNAVLAQKIFDEVAMAVVSRNPDVFQIQAELAEMLELELEQKSPHARASKLLKRLTDGSRILVILDDVGEKLDLTQVGLPVDGDYKGCKVVFTSRVEQVCTNMGAQKNIQVDGLRGAEAWDLFKKMAGECVETAELHPIAKKVLKECGGLPIAIVTLGKALENKQIYAWEDALRELRTGAETSIAGMNDKVYSSIRLSYNSLKTSSIPESQALLKLCCLFPEDANIPVEKLTRYANGLRFYPHLKNLADISNRVYTLLDYLKCCFLILPGDKEMTVKLHDVVRSVCLSIASKDENPYLVRHDLELVEWPEMYEHVTSISLMSQALQKLPSGLEYRTLELLRLQLGGDSVEIQTDFSKEMKGVRVLDFTGFSRWANHLRINALPPALEFLTNLQTLSLEFCELGSDDLSLIGNLKKLETLSFFSSKLDELPSQIGELTNLRTLDLRCAIVPKRPTRIPRGVLCRLERLEELYLGNFDSWQKENYDEQRHKRKDVSIKELSSLSHLRTLQIRVKSPAILLQLNGSWFEKLRKYQLSAVREELSFNEYEIGKALTMVGGEGWRSLVHSKISSLLKISDCLTLHFSTFDNLSENIFEVCANLKTLKMSFCDKIEYIIDEQDPSAALNHLKHLDICSMDDLKEICKGNLQPESLKVLETVKLDSLPVMTHLWKGVCLGNLRVIEVTDCAAVTSIFPHSVAMSLVQLQEIDISKCKLLEGIVSGEAGEIEEANKIIVLRNLTSLSLNDLENLKSFFPEMDRNWSETVKEYPKQLSLERQTDYKTQRCLWFTSKQKTPEDSEHGAPVISENKTSTSTLSLFNQQVILPRLNKLLIRSIRNLESIVDGETSGLSLSKLRILHVDGCQKLLNIAASDFIKLLQCLEQVRVQNCESIETVFDFNGLIKVKEQSADSSLVKLETMSLHKLPKLTQIWKMVAEGFLGLRNLKTLEIFSCGSLKYILSLSVAKMLVNLEKLQVEDCGLVEVIIECEGFTNEIKFPQLCTLQVDKLDSLTSFCSGSPVLEFQKLQKVVIKQCDKMKIFCQGQVKAPRLKRVSQGEDDGEGVWKNDLNGTVMFLHMETEKELLLQT